MALEMLLVPLVGLQPQVRGTSRGWSATRGADRAAAEAEMLLGSAIMRRLTPKRSPMEARSV